MRKEDTTIFEYRKEKDLLNVDAVIDERLHGKFTKGTVRTPSAGYVDFAIYRPEGADEEDVLPAAFSFHGGGFVLGYYETDGKYCQKLADLTGCAIINVDYVLAPEFKFPIPILSSYEAIREIKRNAAYYRIDPDKMMALGHSAGGAIAVDMCLLDREHEYELGLKGMIVDYAPLRQSLRPEDRKAIDPSKAISVDRMVQYIHWYFDNLDDMDHPLASPAIAELEGLPRMLVISAEFDSLSGEEKLFADNARAAGVDVTYEMFAGCRHGFTHSGLKEHEPEQAERAWEMMGKFIRETLNS